MASAPDAQAGSVSKLDCVMSVGVRGKARLSLFRHLAPLTVNAMVRALPLLSRVSLQPAMISLFGDLKVGVEKPKKSFAKGDVAYLASGGLVCIFVKDALSDRPLNPIGKVEEGIDLFEAMRLGEVVRIDPPSVPTAPQGSLGS